MSWAVRTSCGKSKVSRLTISQCRWWIAGGYNRCQRAEFGGTTFVNLPAKASYKNGSVELSTYTFSSVESYLCAYHSQLENELEGREFMPRVANCAGGPWLQRDAFWLAVAVQCNQLSLLRIAASKESIYMASPDTISLFHRDLDCCLFY